MAGIGIGAKLISLCATDEDLSLEIEFNKKKFYSCPVDHLLMRLSTGQDAYLVSYTYCFHNHLITQGN